MVKPHHVVLGGGISGLSLAYLLKTYRSDIDVTLLEQSGRAGGWIESRSKEGILCEMGPRSLRTSGKGLYTLRLVEALGLQKEVIKADPAAKIRYLYRGGQLTPLPHNIGSLLFSPFLSLAAKALIRDWRIKAKDREDESIFTFAERHFGKEAAEQLIDPLTLGIFAGDSRSLSVQACFPPWVESEKKHGSLLKAVFAGRRQKIDRSPWIAEMQKEPIFTFQEGMETLVSALSQQVGESLRLTEKADKLHIRPDGIEVTTAGGNTFFANHVYSTLPLEVLCKLLNKRLMRLPHASVATVAMGFNKKVLKHKGFGYLIPTHEQEEILGMVWDSSAFPSQSHHPDQTRLTVMVNAQTPKDFMQLALAALARHLHINAQPDILEIRVASCAIPQYPIGHLLQVAEAERQCALQTKHLTLLGTAFHGVAVNDCIAKAFSIVEKLRNE